jgi:secreted trypsin-like serine protease
MIVSIRIGGNNQHLCSGTILQDSYILTAAHCLTNRSLQEITIEAGMYYRSESDAKIRQVDRIYIHPNYTVQSNIYVNDIAILHLSLPLDTDYDQNTPRTCLPSNNNQPINTIKYLSDGTRLVIAGWDITNPSGVPRPQILQQAEVYVIDGNNLDQSVSGNQHRHQFYAGRYGNDAGNILMFKIFAIYLLSFCLLSEICYGGM